LPDGAKFGKYCQKSPFSNKFAYFLATFFNAKNLPFLKYQLRLSIVPKFIKLIPKKVAYSSDNMSEYELLLEELL